MRKIVNYAVILFLLVFFISCGTKELKRYYPNQSNSVLSISQVKKLTNTLHGKTVYFFENGDTLSVIGYKGGKFDGPYITFCENGKVESLLNYSSNQLNGLATHYFCTTGNIRSVVEYSTGKLKNVNEQYDLKGNKLYSGNHIDGTGYVLKYSEQGVVTDSFTIENGYIEGNRYLISNTGHVDSIFHINGENEYGLSTNVF